MKEYYL